MFMLGTVINHHKGFVHIKYTLALCQNTVLICLTMHSGCGGVVVMTRLLRSSCGKRLCYHPGVVETPGLKLFTLHLGMLFIAEMETTKNKTGTSQFCADLCSPDRILSLNKVDLPFS